MVEGLEGGLHGGDRSRARRRLTVAQAADQLGVTVDAVRSRVKRGTIEHVREGGRVYIMLGADQHAPSHNQYTAQDASPGELVEELRERVRYLERQVEEERDANRENRRLLAAALERIPAIEAPEEPREFPESAEPRSDRGTTPEEQEEPTSRPSWWRRFFFGG
jgi:excisionase family DNA binding protein